LKNIEQVIYHALQKIDATNPQLREKIYHTVWYSHEKTLRANQHLTQEEKTQKREQLTHLIRMIEAPYHVPQSVSHGISPVPPQRVEKDETVMERPGLDMLEDGAPLTPSPDKIERPHQHKRSWLRVNALLLILLIIFLCVIWSFYSSLVGSPFAVWNQTTSPPPDSQSVAPSVQTGKKNVLMAAQESGIRVFDPVDMMVLSPQGGAHVSLHDESEGRFARIHSREPQDGAVIEIGEGVMMQLRGKAAIFDATVRSASAQATQLSLTCDFGPDINCGRRYFDILSKPETVLFRVDIPEGAAMRGKIFIHDVSNEDAAFDLFDMRVRVQ